MKRIILPLPHNVKRRICRVVRRTRDAALRTRCQIILHTVQGHSRRTIARMLLCAPSTVDRVRRRFVEQGPVGLLDRRGDNGQAKVNEDYLLALITAVAGTPQAYGYPRPTWTQELLVRVLAHQTGITILRSTMCRLRVGWLVGAEGGRGRFQVRGMRMGEVGVIKAGARPCRRLRLAWPGAIPRRSAVGAA